MPQHNAEVRPPRKAPRHEGLRLSGVGPDLPADPYAVPDVARMRLRARHFLGVVKGRRDGETDAMRGRVTLSQLEDAALQLRRAADLLDLVQGSR